MRKHALRALILVAALVALSIPVFSATTTTSACDVFSLNSCTGSSSSSGGIDTVTSPMTFTVGAASFAETQLCGQCTYSIPGSLSIALDDLRGDNSGFVVQLQSFGATAPGTNVAIPGYDFMVTSSDAVNGYCAVSDPAGACELLDGVVPPVESEAPGNNLDAPETIGVACALTDGAEGYGMYTLTEGLNLLIPSGQPFVDEVFGTNPKEWSASFTVTVLQGAVANAVEPCVM